jgi:hypothetical protein
MFPNYSIDTISVITDTGGVMLQRWSKHLTQTLRTLVRRGALFVLAGVSAVTLTLTPVMTQPAHAQLADLLSLGGSFTNGLSSCAIETVGWVVCPTMRSIARLADYGFTYINRNFLRVDSNISNTSSGTYKAWELMRTIANALFVVAFMVLVYSQLTGRNSGGYNIKRLLPRLIVAAIAVNISFYICAILIEISNILGDSFLTIFKDLASRVGTSIMPIDTAPGAFTDGPLTQITSSVMGKAGVAWVLLAPVAAVIVTIATITGAALILLIMRKTVIALIALASPILFVAYLLPNLERFFFQAFRLFVQLLLLYPILAMLLGAGQIVSATIVSVGSGDANYRVTGDNYTSTSGGSGSAITDLTACAAAVVPILGVWFLFKNMSSIMSTAGARLSASIGGRRGSGDKEARVTGKATEGAANAKNPPLMGQQRRQAYSRNRRHASLAGSVLTSGMSPGGGQNRNQAPNATNNTLGSVDAGTIGPDADLQAQAQFEGQEAKVSGELEQKQGMGETVATAVLGAKGREKDKDGKKSVTAKDLFNDLNKNRMGGPVSKDKQRQFGAGPAPAGGGGGGGEVTGGAQPTAPVASYRAPQIAQGGNVVSGSAAGQPIQVVAVPVQVDASALLGGSPAAMGAGLTTPPVAGTEKDAAARANKYLFDAQKGLNSDTNAEDFLGHKENQPLSEQPHVVVGAGTKKGDD